MSILQRFGDIISSNISIALEKYKNSEQEIEKYLKSLYEDLAEIKLETAQVIAREQKAEKTLNILNEEINRYESLAKKALLAGNEDDAAVFLKKNLQLKSEQDVAKNVYEDLEAKADKMRQMHDKLLSDIKILMSKQETAETTYTVAKAQKRINELSGSEYDNVINKLDEINNEADVMLFTASAEAELNSSYKDKISALEAKYSKYSDDVETELARLRKELGL